MIKIYDFNNYLDSGLVYGGHAGDKLGIVYNNQEYLVKFPSSTGYLEKVSSVEGKESKFMNQSRGVTLVALIVTIVVLINW